MKKEKILKKEIEYYSKIYNPQCQKVKELLKKLTFHKK